MELIKLLPQGFCYGVIKAYNNIIKIIEENQDKNIYMLGWLVHNENVINDLKKRKVQILNDLTMSRKDLINQFNNVKNSILILSAHGTSKDVIELAKTKGFIVYDLTCKYVYKTHDIIKEKISDGYQIVFIGKKNHPETIAILKINNNIILVETEDDIKTIAYSEKMFCTNQTTLSILFFDKIISGLKNKFKHIEIENDICSATLTRQKAVLNMDHDVEVCIVVGDDRSSNSNELFKLAQTKCKSYMLNSVSELKKDWFKNVEKVAITAGASTPSYIVEKIANKILEFEND